MGEFKSQCIFKEEPTSKENHHIGGVQRARPYRSNFRRERCRQSGSSEDTEKRGLPPVHGNENFKILVSTGWG